MVSFSQAISLVFAQESDRKVHKVDRKGNFSSVLVTQYDCFSHSRTLGGLPAVWSAKVKTLASCLPSRGSWVWVLRRANPTRALALGALTQVETVLLMDAEKPLTIVVILHLAASRISNSIVSSFCRFVD